MTPIEYQVAHGYGLSEIEAEVKEQLEHGWRPFGGVAIDGADFYQAMVRPLVTGEPAADG